MKINKGHYLELMDRLHIQMCIMDDHLYSHPLSEEQAEVQALIGEAIQKLAKAYQIVGSLEPEDKS